MNKTLISMTAVAFAFVLSTAQAAKHEGPATTPAPAADTKKSDGKKADPIAKACKGKKVGEVVKVDGKDVKCPAKKAAKKKMDKKSDGKDDGKKSDNGKK